ncbi:hypothetical protein PVAP13_2NG336249 [Panicum virgatum]|uniref:Uncharacterized protein n=1 Tax=Panicum virgatum TaxID=38727 RepID=A0A8T0VK58_PANVG|nr:hypothetical protein PVAP13_2NG336249 [Panicum virgatum]
MCGGAILSGFIRPSGPAAKKQQQQLLQHQPRRVTADLLWPGPGRKGAPVGDDFEADFREFVRGLGEDDGADAAGDDGVQEVPPPEPAMYAFAAAAKAATPAVDGVMTPKTVQHDEPTATSAKAYDAEARKIRGKKAKVNFPDEAPDAQKSILKPTTANPTKLTPPPKACAGETFSNLNNGDNDLFAMFAFSDSKVPVKPAEGASFLPAVKPLGSTKRSAENMLSDQSSNSYGSSDFGWDDETMTSDYTSVFAPNNAVAAYANPAYLQGEASKRMRNNYGVAVPQGNGAPNLARGMSGFDPEMNYLPLPYVESSSDTSMDSLLQNDAPQDGASSGDLWSLDELLMAAGAY